MLFRPAPWWRCWITYSAVQGNLVGMAAVSNENSEQFDEFSLVQAKFCPSCFSRKNWVWLCDMSFVDQEERTAESLIHKHPTCSPCWGNTLWVLPWLPKAPLHSQCLWALPEQAWDSPIGAEYFHQVKTSASGTMQESPLWFVGSAGISVRLHLIW